MKSNWNLAPGVTARDVDGPEMVTCWRCEGRGIVEDIVDCAALDCPVCGGDGEITRKENDDQANG